MPSKQCLTTRPVRSPPVSDHPSGDLRCPGRGEAHLWHFDLDAPPDKLGRYRDLLNEGEMVRAKRLIRDLHRDRFIVGRARLRILLGRYLSAPPESFAFTYSEQGKPSLTPPPAPKPLSFNLSHSGGLAIFVIAGFDSVGVDVEAIKDSRDLLPIARRFFSARERDQLLALPEAEQCPAFYQCWASKEALLKAWGTGLATPLEKFTVEVAVGRAGVIEIDLPEHNRVPWRITPLRVAPGYAAAIATPGALLAMKVRNWDEPG